MKVETKIFTCNKTLPPMFSETMQQGKIIDIQLDTTTPQLFYHHPQGQLWLGESTAWMKSLPDASIDMVFADPPYNIKKADWDTFESQQAYVDWSLLWVEQAARILKPTGTLQLIRYTEFIIVISALICEQSQFRKIISKRLTTCYVRLFGDF